MAQTLSQIAQRIAFDMKATGNMDEAAHFTVEMETLSNDEWAIVCEESGRIYRTIDDKSFRDFMSYGKA